MQHEYLNTEESARPLNSTRSRTYVEHEDIKKKLSNIEEHGSKLTENITCSKFCIFVIYVFSLIQSTLWMQNSLFTFANNISIEKSVSNLVETNTGREKIDSYLIDFDEINSVSNLHTWFVSNFLYTLYSKEASFQSFDYVPDNSTIMYFQVLSPIRFLVSRATYSNVSHSWHSNKWDKDQSDSQRTPYGLNGVLYNYSNAEGGYVYRMPITYQSKIASTKEYIDMRNSGFFDEFLKKLVIDVVIFNKLDQYWTLLQADFEFAGSGYIKNKDLKIFSYAAKPYVAPGNPDLAVSQILFFMMFLYYFFQEFLKIYVQIKNALLSNMPSGAVSVEQAAKLARQKIQSVLKGILNHIKDPLTFVNVLSISFSFFLIYEWIDYRVNSEMIPMVNKLELKNGVVENLTPEKKQIFNALNQVMQKEANKILLIYQIASLNIMILVIKGLSYFSYLINSVSNLQKLISKVRDRLLPLIVMLAVFVYSFSIFTSFYFGARIEEFNKGIPYVMLFFVNVVNNYFDLVDVMYGISPLMTIILVVFFAIIGNFVLVSIFQITNIHTFEEFAILKSEMETKKVEHKSMKPHLSWTLKTFFERDFKIYHYKLCNKKKAKQLKQDFDRIDRKLALELQPYKSFNFDIHIGDHEVEESGKHYFRNEISNFKLMRIKKVEFIKLVWRMLGLGLFAILILIISLEHHKITEGRSMVNSADNLFEQRSVIFINDLGKKETIVTNRTVDKIQNYPELLGWMVLFESFGQQKSYKLSSGEILNGNFFGGVNYLLTGQYRMTVRKTTITENPDPDFKAISALTLSPTFEFDDIDPEGESVNPIKGLVTGTVYNYTKKGSYLNVGGYTIYSDVAAFLKMFNNTIKDGLLDEAVISVIIDFPIYQPTTSNALYGKIQLVLDDAYNFMMETSVQLCALNYYKTSNQKFLAFIEVLVIVMFIYLITKLIKNIKKKYTNYNLWYSLHVVYFPQIMHDLRAKKTPEWVRKFHYCFKFDQFADIFIIFFLFCSIIVWIDYLVQVKFVDEEIQYFLSKSSAADFSNLTDAITDALAVSEISKIFEALLIIMIALKIIHDYSYFDNFKFLTNTLRRSVNSSKTLLNK